MYGLSSLVKLIKRRRKKKRVYLYPVKRLIMRYILIFCIVALSACGNTIYIVRHAEKEPVPAGASQQAASDPPLSEAGNQRANDLKGILENQGIQTIYSTNYKRTISTAMPLSNSRNIPIQTYNSRKDSMDAFISRLRTIRKGNVLVVGHSNTIDDLANKLANSTVVPGDLDESEYDNLFILKRKGDNYTFSKSKYGKTK